MSDRDSQPVEHVAVPSTAMSADDAPQNDGAIDASQPILDLSSADDPVLDLRDGSAPETPVVDQLIRNRLFGLDFVDAPDLHPVVEALVERHRPSNRRHVSTVLTPNVDIMVQLDEDRTRSGPIWDMFRSSQFCLPDGQPIVIASSLLGQPLSARLTGSGLFALIWPRLVKEQRSVFVIASSEEVADLLRQEYPATATLVPPMFSADDAAVIDTVAQAVISSATLDGPEFVFLGIGHPKDALVADSILQQWPSGLGRPPTILALGGSASMYVGITRRAPAWVQRIGMEWFYRFAQEPRRLFHRYFVRDTAFLGLVWRERRAQQRGGQAADAPRSEVSE